MSEDGCDVLTEPDMEIRIDTLMGTSFDMRVSSTDTVRDIKQRIYRVEGIPVHQLNLIHQSQELKDCRRLCDVGIKDGSVLKLVASMKGGPISTRRLATTSCDHHVMLKELKELLENTRDEIGDKLAPGSKVSVLVFKEGDILNLLRVIENEDGSYSPYTSEKPAISPPIRQRKDSQMAIFKKFVEDTEMMSKISNLRRKMDDLQLRKQAKRREQMPESTPSSSNISYKLLTDCMDLKIFENHEEDDEEIALKDKHRLKPIKSIYSASKGAYSHTKSQYLSTKNCDERIHLTRLVLAAEEGKSPQPESIELLEESAEDVWEIQEPKDSSAACKLSSGFMKRRVNFEAQKEFDVSNFFQMSTTSSGYYRAPLYNRKSTKTELYEQDRDDASNKHTLGPVVRKRSRCNECNKRLNITNIYDCRCGKIFCSVHRYSEVHRCTHDYKTEGKKLLHTQNPLVTADKIDRI